MRFTDTALGVYRWIASRYPLLRSVFAPLRRYYHYNPCSYAIHRMLGLSHREWYAKTLDAFASHVEAPPNLGVEKDMGQYQLDYLKQHGLLPAHSLLDFGCSHLRAGIGLIQYLDPGRYVGADISRGRLAQGQREVEKLGLMDRAPELVWVPDLTLDAFAPRTFDVIWAHGVMVVMPPEDVVTFLHNLHKVMHSRSRLLGNFPPSRDARHEWIALQYVSYNYTWFEQTCEREGLKVELLGDLPHPLSEKELFVEITLKASP